MSSCDNSNIKQNYIVTNTNEFETLTACTGIWTSNIYGCSPVTVQDQLKLNSVSNNNTLNRILVIDNLTGLVQYRNINTIISGSSGISDFTYDNENTFTITDTSGNILSATIDVMSALTINGVLSATTYLGLPLDVYVTGGTYSNGVVTFINNSGGTFNISGFLTGTTQNLQQVVNNGNGITNFGGLGNASIQSTNFVNNRTLLLNNDSNPTLRIVDNTNASHNLTIDLDTLNLNGTPYNWSNIVNQDQIVTISGGTNISVTGTYPNFTIDVTGLTDNNTYTTGFTYQDNTFIISDTSGNTFSATIDVMSALTINGVLSATTYQGLPLDVYVTGGTYFGGSLTFTNNSGDTFNIGGLYTGQTNYVNSLTTGVGLSANTTTGNISIINTDPDQIVVLNDGLNISVTGTYPNFTIDVTGITDLNTYVTGFTYNPSTNTLTIEQNEGESPLSQTITTVSGLSFSNLTQGRVVYVGSSGLLTDESEFTYNEGTDTLGVTNIEASGDVTIQGSLKVFGPSISAFTSELYVEDPNITLNYNPTGSTTLTSVGSGWVIQDGSGIANTATTLNIGVSYLNANLNPNTEYTSSTGNQNRNFYTQLNDIIIRNTNYNSSAPNGVRVLAEGDILDGGSY